MLYNTFHNRWLRLIAAVAGEFIAALASICLSCLWACTPAVLWVSVS